MSLSFIFQRLVSAFQEGLNPSYLGIHYNFFFFFFLSLALSVVLDDDRNALAILPKGQWQVTSKHAHTLHPTKSKWADLYAVQA